MEKPKNLTKANVPISETGMVIGRNDGAAPVLQENEDHENDEDDGFEQRAEHVSIDSPTASVVSNATLYFIPGGKRFDKPLQFGNGAAGPPRAHWHWKAE